MITTPERRLPAQPVDPLVGKLLDTVRLWYAADIGVELDGFHQLRRAFYQTLHMPPPDPVSNPQADKASWGEVVFARDGVADE